MSYVLHVWESPAPASLEEACEFIFNADKQGMGPSPKFPAFAAALREMYPDSEEDGDTLWIDGSIDGLTQEPVYVLGLVNSRVDDDTIEFIAHTAADHGLFVFDMQGARLYRPDRRVQDVEGWMEDLAPRRLPSRAPRSKPPSENDVEERMLTRIGERLAPAGWIVHIDPLHAQDSRLWRQQGAITQELHFTAGESAGEHILGANLAFHSPDVDRALRELLLPHQLEAKHPTRLDRAIIFDHVLTALIEVFPEAHELYPETGSSAFVRTMDEVDAWCDCFCRWYAANAAARMDACRDVAGLNLLLHTQGRSRSGRLWFAYTMYSTLVIIDMGAHPQVDFDAWVENLRDKQKRGATGGYLDRLIERLKQRRAARSSALPKGSA